MCARARMRGVRVCAPTVCRRMQKVHQAVKANERQQKGKPRLGKPAGVHTNDASVTTPNACVHACIAAPGLTLRIDKGKGVSVAGAWLKEHRAAHQRCCHQAVAVPLWNSQAHKNQPSHSVPTTGTRPPRSSTFLPETKNHARPPPPVSSPPASSAKHASNGAAIVTAQSLLTDACTHLGCSAVHQGPPESAQTLLRQAHCAYSPADDVYMPPQDQVQVCGRRGGGARHERWVHSTARAPPRRAAPTGTT